MSNQKRATELKTLIDGLNTRILGGDILGAFDDYYGDNVVMIDPQAVTEGKSANRTREEEWLGGVTAFHGAAVLSVGVDPENDVTLSEWKFDYEHNEWGHVQNHQVSVAKWDGDKIVREQFIYSQ